MVSRLERVIGSGPLLPAMSSLPPIGTAMTSKMVFPALEVGLAL